MRKVIILVLLSLTFAASAHAETKSISDGLFSEKRADYTLEGAARNLQENKMFYVRMKEHVDGATGLIWRIHLGIALPSQPVAVIDILSLTGTDPASVCPRFFHEDTWDSDVLEWNENAVEALRAFRMADPKKDAIRQECLKDIVEADKQFKAKLEKKRK